MTGSIPRDPIDETISLSGGPLDFAVATEVMGKVEGTDFGIWSEHDWRRDADGEIDVWAYETDFHNGPMCSRCYHDFCHVCVPEGYDDPCEVEYPAYSTKPTKWGLLNVFEVIERLRQQGWDVELRLGAGGFTTCVMRHERFGKALRGGESIHLAVCRAALAAVRTAKEEGPA